MCTGFFVGQNSVLCDKMSKFQYIATMKTLPLYFLIFLNFSAGAQDEPMIVVPKKVSRFYTGVELSGLSCYRKLSSGNSGIEVNGLIELRNDSEVPKWSYSFALLNGYRFNRYLALELGVGFANRGFRMIDVSITTVDAPEGTGELTDINWNDYYVNVPLRVNFTLGKGHLRFLSGAGITTGFFVTETFRYTDAESIPDKTISSPYVDLYQKINVFPSLYVGGEWQLAHRMRLRVETGFQYGLLQLSDTPITTHLYNGLLNVSYLFHL